MTNVKLMNYTIADFLSKQDMELRLYKWEDEKKNFLPKLKENGMLRFSILRVWNKEGVFRLGYLFEYKDEEAYKDCQEIWQDVEKKMKSEHIVKVFANRGIVIEDNILN